MHMLDHVQAGLESENQEEQVKEDLVVHKCQVAWVLTLPWARQAVVHHTTILDFCFELISLC
jgi:hypothetical protein